MTKIETAIYLATHYHRGQKHESGSPYILHPLRVGMALQSEGKPEAVVIAGFLHDTLEDTHIEREEIVSSFSEDVAAAVDALTRRPDESYEAFIERISLNEIATQVKIADLRDNLWLGTVHPLTDPERQKRFKARYEAALIRLGAEVLPVINRR